MALQKEIAVYLDLSVERIRELTRDGIIPASKGTGGYKKDDCRLAYIRYLRNLASGKVKAAPSSQSEEKTRLTKAQADRAELDLKVANGEFIPVDLVAERWSRIASDLKSRLLAIPARMIPRTLALKKPAAIEAVFKKFILEALAELSSGTSKKPVRKKAAPKKKAKKKKVKK